MSYFTALSLFLIYCGVKLQLRFEEATLSKILCGIVICDRFSCTQCAGEGIIIQALAEGKCWEEAPWKLPSI